MSRANATAKADPPAIRPFLEIAEAGAGLATIAAHIAALPPSPPVPLPRPSDYDAPRAARAVESARSVERGGILAPELRDVEAALRAALRERPPEELCGRHCPLVAGPCLAPACVYWSAPAGPGLCVNLAGAAAAALAHLHRRTP